MDKLNMVFDTAAVTHQGRVRTVNEDNYLLQPASRLWAVSDGMGGHREGRTASALVVEELGRIGGGGGNLLAECMRALEVANARLRAHAAAVKTDMIGATVALLHIHGDGFSCIWSGDSRIYRAREGAIAQLTRDHSEVEELVAEGVISREEARTWPRRNVVTRAIGASAAPELEIVDGIAEAGDIFVLCSDGLTCHVEDEEIRDLVLAADPKRAADNLVALALERGGRDNVTVVVVRCVPQVTAGTDPGRSGTGQGPCP